MREGCKLGVALDHHCDVERDAWTTNLNLVAPTVDDSLKCQHTSQKKMQIIHFGEMEENQRASG